MKETLTTHQIAYRLKSDENAGWSYRGALALAEYLEELEQDTGEEMEFDKVAIRCDFSEYASLKEWAKDYFSDWRKDLNIEGDATDDQIDEAIRELLGVNGQLIEFNGGVIVSSF